jgi:TolA-binding protein
VSARSCRRRFEVEAARDGRITGPARTSIEQHISTCEVCAAQDRALREVSDALAALPVAETDALSVRRQRQRILALFDEAQARPAVRRTNRRWAAGVVLVAGALAASVVFVATRGQRAAPTATSPKPEERADDVVVVVPETARWSRVEQGSNTRLKLDDGELDIHVKHHGEAHGLLVKLPDGELDDIGTTFRVRVEEGRTVAVVVREGAVVLRRDGAGPVLLGAGESWSADDSWPTASSSVASTGPSAPAPTPPPPPRVASIANKPDGAKEFRDGVDLLSAGNAAQAAVAFRAYLARGPGAERTEDAMYLLVLALHRSGDDPEAQSAARDYLRVYPHGLRRQEVVRLFPTAADR